MAYYALYRKYRSQSFSELMGQEQVTRTLQNAIKTKRIAHAYLFHGARGCGKTSTARLMARALNCVSQDSPSPEPCGVCPLCVAIREGTCLDVVEIDAASKTGIDDVREQIIENVQYAPAEARYKVYIIDEVHDLSAKAFDALLKTLEEPPGHVIFILATTEWLKVPITIRSRCQPFQFKRGSLQDLSAAIQRVITGEGYSAEPEAVLAIARSAEGSWRDALSLLEQVIAYSDGTITTSLVHRAIGTVGTERIEQIIEAIASADWSRVLAVAAEMMETGTDVRQLLTSLSGYLRDLLILASGAKQAAEKEFGAERLARLTEHSTHFKPAQILTMLDILAASEREIRFSNQHRWLLERTLLRLLPENHAPEAVAPTPEVRAAVPTRTIPRPELPTPTPRPTPIEAKAVVVEQVPPPPIETHQFAEAISLDVVKRSWERILRAFEKVSPAGLAYLQKAQVVDLQGTTVVLAFSEEFAKGRMQDNAKGRAAVEKTINQVLKTSGYTIRSITAGDANSESTPRLPSEPTEALALMDAPEQVQKPTTPQRIADFDIDTTSTATSVPPVSPPTPAPQPTPQANTFVTEALELFGGEVVQSEPL